MTRPGHDWTALPAGSLLFDGHVHSTFSDGTSDPVSNLQAAVRAGLTDMVMADHVRRASDWLPVFVSAVDDLRGTSETRIRIGVETRMVDTRGVLDVPDLLDGVDLVLIADHRLPTPNGPADPVAVRDALATGEADRTTVIGQLLDAMIAAVTVAPLPAVLVHPFSLLPKLGLAESELPDERLQALADRCRETSTAVEVNEKWRCPNLATLRVFQESGVTIVAGSDAHASDAVGRYEYVRDVIGALAPGAVLAVSSARVRA